MKTNVNLGFLTLALGALGGVAAAQGATPDISTPAGMKLVWHDEFNDDGPIDTSKWTVEEGYVRNQNDAFQIYQQSNARVESGNLIITARRERVANPFYKAGSPDWRFNRPFADYTSSGFNTRDKQSWLYGHFEMRAKIDPRQSSWPAFWTIGDKGPWPQGGELDILEFYGGQLVGNVWWGGAEKGKDQRRARVVPIKKYIDADPQWADKFHVWAMDWDENKITMTLDGEVFHTYDVSKSVNGDGTGRNPLREPQILILNQAIGQGKPDKVDFPYEFVVDYVRVFQKN